MATLREEDLAVVPDNAPKGVRFLESLAGMMGAMEEGKSSQLKKKKEEQDYYDTLRRNGYSAGQAYDIVMRGQDPASAGLPKETTNDLAIKQENYKQEKLSTEKSRLEVDKAQAEKDRGYKTLESDLTANQQDENKRNKSSVVQLLNTGQYFDSKTGKFERVKSKEQMVSYLIDKFPGKVDFEDADIKNAINTRFPDPKEREGIMSKLGKVVKQIFQGKDVKIRAKKSGRTFTASPEKAKEAIASGLFEEAK